MNRVNEILRHPYYRECLSKIGQLEAERRFCRHNMAHFLDVARVACLLSQEERADVPKELIYAAALLHDIGRHEQYLYGVSHDEAGARIAEGILSDCGFEEADRKTVLEAVSGHRSAAQKKNLLADLICRADKLSRACFCCPAESECNWSTEKKNLVLKY